MINLLASDERSAFGIATALDFDRIPFRRIERAEDFDGRVLVIAGADVSAAAALLAARVPSVAIGTVATLARTHFGVAARTRPSTVCTLRLDEAVWPAGVRERARRFGKTLLRIPQAPVAVADGRPRGRVLANLRADWRSQPGIVAAGTCCWSLVDLGTALTDLIAEAHVPHAPRGSALPRPVQDIYYRLPAPVRAAVQRVIYARLRRRLARWPGASSYPVDATGWLLVELVQTLVRRAAGGLVRLARWPAPHDAAAVLTHDLEPTPFAYTAGLDELMRRVAHAGHPATFGVVDGPAGRHLTSDGRAALRTRDVLCHGLEHRGETLLGSLAEVEARLRLARSGLEATLARPVGGFRSPRLDRSPDLARALDQAGFRYDSSWPDVDRETTDRFGAGVRLTLPFRPPLDDARGGLRPSACLELPVSAPDCIQPLLAGEGLPALRRAVRQKIAFVRATGGLYVGIVHGGVFGPRDAAQRGSHLAFVHRQLVHPDVWLASASDVAAWWWARESVRVWADGGRVVVMNHGLRPIDRLRVVVERDGGESHHDLPVLGPGQSSVVGAVPLRQVEREEAIP